MRDGKTLNDDELWLFYHLLESKIEDTIKYVKDKPDTDIVIKAMKRGIPLLCNMKNKVYNMMSEDGKENHHLK